MVYKAGCLATSATEGVDGTNTNLNQIALHGPKSVHRTLEVVEQQAT